MAVCSPCMASAAARSSRSGRSTPSPATAAWARYGSAIRRTGKSSTTPTARPSWPRPMCSSTGGWCVAETTCCSAAWKRWASARPGSSTSRMPASGSCAARRACTPSRASSAGPAATGWPESPRTSPSPSAPPIGAARRRGFTSSFASGAGIPRRAASWRPRTATPSTRACCASSRWASCLRTTPGSPAPCARSSASCATATSSSVTSRRTISGSRRTRSSCAPSGTSTRSPPSGGETRRARCSRTCSRVATGTACWPSTSTPVPASSGATSCKPTAWWGSSARRSGCRFAGTRRSEPAAVLQVHRADRVGDHDPLVPVPPVQALDELVLDEILRHVLLPAQGHRELNRGVAERVVTDGRREVPYPPLDLLHDLPPHLDGHDLDFSQIRVVAHADVELHRLLGIGQAEIGGDGRSELGVRNDREIVRQLADRGVAPGDVLDVALLPRAKPNEVTRSHLARQEDVDPGEEIREGILQRQSDRQPADSEGGEERRAGNAEPLEDDKGAKPEHDRLGQVRDQVDRGERGALRPGARGDHVPGGASQGPRDGDHDHHDQQPLDHLRDRSRQLGHFGGQVEPQHPKPQHDRSAQGRDDDVVRRQAGPCRRPGEPRQDGALDQQAHHEARQRECGRQRHRGEHRERERRHRSLLLYKAAGAASLPPVPPLPPLPAHRNTIHSTPMTAASKTDQATLRRCSRGVAWVAAEGAAVW